MNFSFLRTGEYVEGIMEYNAGRYMETTIRRIIVHFTQLLQEVLGDLELKLSRIDILPPQEKRQVLFDFNDIKTEYPPDKTIHRLFEEQVARTPHSIAITVQHEGETAQNEKPPSLLSVTYDHLNRKAGQLARVLTGKSIKPGSLAAILIERSVEMIVGILGILKAGCGYVPLNQKAPVSRMEYMLKECDAGILLTTRGLEQEGENKKPGNWNGETIFLDELNKTTGKTPQLTAAAVSPSAPQELFEKRAAANCLAYVIFTSGSTGQPKGVPITHSNLSPLLHWGYDHLGLSTADRTLQNLAYNFDWSVWEIFITLTSGASLWAITDELLLNPETCTGFINTHGITVLHVTPTQFRYLTQVNSKIRTLTYLFIGAEKLPLDLVERSLEQVSPHCRIFNMYGPTEAAIISAVLEIDRFRYKDFENLSSVPIGRPAGNARLLVLDRYLKPSPINTEGELYIAGDGLAQGYLNDPGKTANAFVRNIYEPEGIKGKFLYKTGDLCRRLPDGNIEFLRRADHQLKIRGYRIELGEIETRLRKHPEVKETAVLAKEDEAGDTYLCAYVVRDAAHSDSMKPAELKKYLSQSLPGYMIPTCFTELDKIPITSNGKIDRKALPVPVIKGERRYTPPGNEEEKKLVEIWSEVLHREKDIISIDSDFFELGGHSLKAVTLVSKIHKELGVKILLIDVFKNPTVKGLSRYAKKAKADKFISLEPVEKMDYYPLSSVQKRLYIMHQMNPHSTVYNIPAVVPLSGEPDLVRLEETFIKLIRRHDSLRTSFQMVDNQPIQEIHDADALEFKIGYYDIGTDQVDVKVNGKVRDKIEAVAAVLKQPFDISRAPLLKVGVVKKGEGKFGLAVMMHHIISDGVSHVILETDFMALYHGRTLPPLNIRYKDFAAWQNGEKEKEKIKRQKAYWLKEFAGEIPVLDIPTDYPRPVIQSFAGSTIPFKIGITDTRLLKTYAREQSVTLFMLVLSIANIWLAKLSSQEEIVIGTPAAGRRHADLQEIIGMFVNTLPLKNLPTGEKTFFKFLADVKEKALAAFENQEYQFEDLVEKVAVNRDAGRNPLFDVF